MRSKLFGAGAFLLLAVSFARTEPGLPTAPTPHDAPPIALKLRVELLLPYINDPAFQKELSLTPDQVKKLLALRQERWDEEYNTPLKDLVAKRAERDAALSAAFRKVLTADQFRRAEQLILHIHWRPALAATVVGNRFAPGPATGPDLTRVGPVLLESYPDLARALWLSDEQKRFTELPATSKIQSVVLLTAAQNETARDLLGPAATGAWKAERDPRVTESLLLTNTDTLSPIRIVDTYRAELKITDEQSQRIGKPGPSLGTRYRPDASRAEAVKLAREDDAASEKELAKVLSPEQMARLKQIALRVRLDPALGHATEPLVLGLAGELKVTAQQRDKFDALIRAHSDAVNRAVVLDDTGAAMKAVRAASAELDKGLLAALTDEQRAKLKELAGDPLPTKRARAVLALTEAALKQREATFGKYTDELSLLNANKGFQKELDLSADQLDLTRKTLQVFSKQFGTGNPWAGVGAPKKEADPEKIAERSKFIGEALASILDKQQRKRFRELVLQYRESKAPSAFTTNMPALAYPGVAEELKLTEEQKKQVIAGESALDVLTDEQRKAFKAMLGERFAFDSTAAPGGWGLGTRPEPLDLLQKERDRADFLKVAPLKALNLKPEQHTKLAVAVNAYQLSGAESAAKKGNPWQPPAGANPGGKGNPWGGGGGPGGPWGAPGKKIDTPDKPTVGAVLAFQRELSRTLDNEIDIPRIDELALQSRAAHNLRDTLTRADTAKALNLTATQLAQIADLEDEGAEVGALVNGLPLSVAARDDALRRLRDKIDAHTFALLTPDQLKKWKDMTGEPYEFVKTVIRGPVSRPRTSPGAGPNPWGR